MDVPSASVSAYDVGDDGPRAVKASMPADFELDQATRAACGTNT
ncbi:hypothetical protein [Amycolatopsis sp. SID8362]|nr:hypothetical protein [Amycolatopsis sp. SID8362]